MEEYSALATVIVIFTAMFTYQGLKESSYQNQYSFWVDKILIDREFGRMFSSGFLHVGWLHFAFNMIALLSFATFLEAFMPMWQVAVVYFGSLLGGSALALFIHKNHGNYRAVGASGAVSGLVFASIVLYPAGKVSLFIISLPNWFFVILFIGITIFGLKTNKGNVGHSAHLGGALTGILLALALLPSVVLENQWMLALTLIPILGFLALIIQNPSVLLVDNYWGEGLFDLKEKLSPKPKPKKSIDEILDKIKKTGLKSLTKKERDILDRFNEG